MSSKPYSQFLLNNNQLKSKENKINSLVLQFPQSEESKELFLKTKQRRRFSLQSEINQDVVANSKKGNIPRRIDQKYQKFKNINKWEMNENSDNELNLTLGYLLFCTLIAISIFLMYGYVMNKT